MADKTATLILDALQRALAAPQGLPLVGGKSALFAANAAGRLAAQQARATGFLQVLRSEPRGNSTQEICGLADEGLHFLLERTSPRAAVEGLLIAVAERAQQLEDVRQTVDACRESLAALQRHAEHALDALVEKKHRIERNGAAKHAAPARDAWHADVMTYLNQWPAAHPNEDCPLPEVYRHARRSAPVLTVGLFHDGLRSLHEQGKIYLYPWTGPLYEIPEPALALMVGHALAFYVGLRQ